MREHEKREFRVFFRPDPLFPLTACVEDDPMFVHTTWVGDTCVICIFLV